MMKDNHVAGEGNAYYTLFREYDPDLGRWWRPDPIFQPWQSPYSAFDGNPIMLTDVWGLESVRTPDVVVEADRIKDQTESERYSALSAYYMNEARLFWSGYGLPNQVIPITSDNSQNSILASTQANSQNIGKPPASQVPNVRGKKRANTTISTPNASGNTITIDDNFVKRENQMIENKKNYKIGNRVYRGDVNTVSINSGMVLGIGANGSLDYNEDYYGNALPTTTSVKALAGYDVTFVGAGVSSTWYSCPEEFVDADLMQTNSFKDRADLPGYSLSIGIGVLSLSLGYGINRDGISYFSWGLGVGVSIGKGSFGPSNTFIKNQD